MTFDQFVDKNCATINRDGGKWVLSYTKNAENGYRLMQPIVHEISAWTLDELKSKTEVYIYDNLIDSFYLEISGRQTGKTTRLVNAMIDHLSCGGSCILYTHSRKMFQVICEIIYHEYGDVSKVKYYLDKGIEMERVRNYFDEFDFNDKLQSLGAFDAKGYYCTTVTKLRDIKDLQNPKGDLLLELIKHSNFNFESRKNPNMLSFSGIDEKRKIESGQIFK